MVWMAPGDRGKYSRMADFIKSNIANVPNDAKVYGAWMKWCMKGGKYKITARLGLIHGLGPQLKFVALTNANGEYRTATPTTIYLDLPIGKRFQKDYKMAKAILLAQSTILHEMVHWADWTADKTWLKKEGGKDFEKDAYGKDVQRYF